MSSALKPNFNYSALTGLKKQIPLLKNIFLNNRKMMNTQTENSNPETPECDKRMSLKSATLITSFIFMMLGCLVILAAMFAMISSPHVILMPLLALAGAGLCWLSGAYYSSLKRS